MMMSRQRAAARRSNADEQTFIWNLGTSEIYRFSQRRSRRARRRRAVPASFPWFSPIQ